MHLGIGFRFKISTQGIIAQHMIIKVLILLKSLSRAMVRMSLVLKTAPGVLWFVKHKQETLIF